MGKDKKSVSAAREFVFKDIIPNYEDMKIVDIETGNERAPSAIEPPTKSQRVENSRQPTPTPSRAPSPPQSRQPSPPRG
jgi:hypothetical protein